MERLDTARSYFTVLDYSTDTYTSGKFGMDIIYPAPWGDIFVDKIMYFDSSYFQPVIANRGYREISERTRASLSFYI